ncbi:hypothetical protein ES332_D06G219700v1 [Gossypium tomentosum]|uniref:WAT1-related protein n=1 Tax=Gossypium tomentosum TaxID=34277 RepID=A0A5D2KMC1_GOSTO|nr:hypothetical protein ES332_D06G219700v1 [Gossypium tomentosum]
MSSKSSASVYNQALPYVAMVLMRFGSAGMPIVAKYALNRGMSQHVLVVYRFIIATLVLAPFAIVFDRKVRPKMTLSVFVQIALLGLLEPAIDQNLYYTGIKYTTATVATALCNVLPAFVFLLAWVCRLEKVDVRKVKCQAKILGTIGTVAGAMIMTMVYGPMLPLPWTKVNNHHQSTNTDAKNNEDALKGAVMILVGCVCWACFVILQGIICSGVAYYIGAMVIQAKGPVFFASFNPLTMVIVAIMSSFIFSEIMYLGRVIGAMVIVVGLYMVLWGKSKDQISSDSSNNTKDEIPISGDELQMATQTTTPISNQDFVVLDLNKGAVSNQSSKNNPK